MASKTKTVPPKGLALASPPLMIEQEENNNNYPNQLSKSQIGKDNCVVFTNGSSNEALETTLDAGLDNDQDCLICGCKLCSPRVLSCLHVFCEGCLDNLLIDEAGDSKVSSHLERIIISKNWCWILFHSFAGRWFALLPSLSAGDFDWGERRSFLALRLCSHQHPRHDSNREHVRCLHFVQNHRECNREVLRLRQFPVSKLQHRSSVYALLRKPQSHCFRGSQALQWDRTYSQANLLWASSCWEHEVLLLHVLGNVIIIYLISEEQ